MHFKTTVLLCLHVDAVHTVGYFDFINPDTAQRISLYTLYVLNSHQPNVLINVAPI